MKLEGKKFGEGFKERKKSGFKKGKRTLNSRREKFAEGKIRRGKNLEKDLRNKKNREGKKKKSSMKIRREKVWRRI